MGKMKRLLLTLATAACVAAATPMTAPAFADDGGPGRGRAERPEPKGRPWVDRDEGRGADRRSEDRRGDDRRRYGPPPGRGWERIEPPPAGYADRPRPNYMQGPRPSYLGPPPGARRGYVPDGYRGEVVEDYRRYRLRPPPQGYAWVRMGGGFALVDMGSGRIFDRVD